MKKRTMTAKTREEQEALLSLLDEKIKRLGIKAAQNDLIKFAEHVYPNYSVGGHHKIMARIFKDIVDGKKKRVIINIAPRHGKSELTSYLFPAWFLGQKPTAQVIMATHTVSLSEDFGRRVRNLLSGAEYKSIFPETRLADDSKSAGSWSTSKGGKYYAVGVGGALAGRGADLLVIDDPHSEQDLKSGSKLPFEQAWTWYQTGPRQRLMWGGAIVVVMTRWGQLDLTAKLIDYQTKNPDADQWEVIEFPAILPSGKALWPDKWPVEELMKTKATINPRFWNAQYQQEPTSDSVAIIKREMWREWEPERPPNCEFVIQSWDTAHDTKSTNDYSACTTWGVWYNEEDNNQPNIILLDAFKDRMEFPELKQVAIDQYKDLRATWGEDRVIVLIEKKAAGAPLIQELRRIGLPVQEFTPSRGNDKTVRVNAVADLFASGKVWAPGTRWANEVIEEIAAFPVGEHDDFVDTATQALLRFRQGSFISLDSDEKDAPRMFKSHRHAGYY
jgi:predicted phage terminase large subunit-like protein